MGSPTTALSLAQRWADIIEDPTLRDLPYKVELNAWGKIEMSPASNRHGRLQARTASELSRQMPEGEAITEASVLTDIGVRVPDVVWASASFLKEHGEETPFSRAPEICIEIVSPSNSDAETREKVRAYLAAGATEVWVIPEDAQARYFDRSGEVRASRYPVKLDLPGPLSTRSS
jgi:Uma2 family endonuclease